MFEIWKLLALLFNAGFNQYWHFVQCKNSWKIILNYNITKWNRNKHTQWKTAKNYSQSCYNTRKLQHDLIMEQAINFSYFGITEITEIQRSKTAIYERCKSINMVWVFPVSRSQFISIEFAFLLKISLF